MDRNSILVSAAKVRIKQSLSSLRSGCVYGGTRRNDLFGPATIENFKKLGIDATHVKQVEGLSSGVAPIFVEANGQNRILVVKGANDR